ncbi:MAG: ABC transporter permease [Myxococcota bacterium]
MGDNNLAALAWRNIWRNRRRTIITLFGISFGVFLAVLMTGIGDYTYTSMINQSARLGAGHVVVQHPDYQELPTLKKTVAKAAEVEAAAAGDAKITKTVSRIAGAALVATASASQGAMFMAIDPTREDDGTLAFLDDITEGEMLTAPKGKGVVIGSKLAETLGLRLGKKMVYTVTDRSGEIVSGLARVTGIVTTGSPSIDGGLCLLPIDTVRELLGYDDGEATQVAVFVADHRDAPEVAASIAAGLGDGAVVLTWDQASPELAGFIEMKEVGAIVMEIIIMILLAAGIFNTLFVSVMERMREFGIMSALGFSAGALFGLVMWESLWLALVGLVAAAAVTAFPYYHFNTVGIDYSKMIGEGAEVVGIAVEPIMYVDIFFEHAVAIAAAVVVSTLASGLYPAWRAGRTNPADVIRLQ